MATASYLDRETEVRGLKLHYQEWGRPGNPVILALHGFGVSGHMFDEFADRASDTFHIIALDQRGHGDSAWSEDGNYSRDAFVEDVEAFRNAVGLDRFVLMGHSMGGLNAVAYTARYPEAVAALILVDVGPEAAKEGVDNIVRFTRGPDELEFEQFVEMAHRFNQRRTIENIRDRMRHRLKPIDGGKWTWKFDSRFRQQENGLRIGSEMSNEEMWSVFQSLTGPTLLIRGSESDVLTQETAERAAREMQNARLVVVPGAGHSVPGDSPDAFTEAVRNFVSSLEPAKEKSSEAPAAVEVSDGPTLSELVESHDEGGRKRPSSMVLFAIAGVAAASVIGLGLFATRKGMKRTKKKKPSFKEDLNAIRQGDVQLAREHAADLAHDLERLARVGARRARNVAHQVELAEARERALEIAHALGERSLAAERRVQSAVVPRGKKLAKRKPVTSTTATGIKMAKLLVSLAMMTSGMRKKQAPRKALPWRR